MLSIIAKAVVPVAVSMAGEELYLRAAAPILYASSSLIPFLPRAYAGVIAINAVSSGFALVLLGGKVGEARKKYTEKAKKDGDADAEARFAYPKIYAEGFSEAAKLFNCVQRGHQHALETYTMFVALSLIAGVKYPVTAMIGGVVWHISRFAWAKGYATGDPQNRYANFWGIFVWTSLLIEMFAAIGTAVALAK